LKSAALLTSAFADEPEISDFPGARAFIRRRLRLMAFRYEHDGFCPCCETRQIFAADSDWFRDSLVCPNCGSVVRERALALILREILPDWRNRAIHESSPAQRGLSARMPREAPGYVATHFFPGEPLGAVVRGFRNENLESQTFESDTFDLVLTLDVMEHVFDPAKVYAEIWRTLKPGGRYLHTFPIRKHLTEACTPLAKLMPDGTVKHLTERPEYHGNPIDVKGSLVTLERIARHPRLRPGYFQSDRPMGAVRPLHLAVWDETHGAIGEYTEVVVCRKRG